MVTMLLSLTSLYIETDITQHPRICILFNNVSKFSSYKEKNDDSESEGQSVEEVGEQTSQSDYIPHEAFITQYRDLLFERAKILYKELNNDQFLQERIEALFPDSNFYFYKIRTSKKEIALERTEIEKFVRDSIAAPRLYIKSGKFEPVHMKKPEREILVNQMQDMMKTCYDESINDQREFGKKTNNVSPVLQKQSADIKELLEIFDKQAKETPWVFQKCQLRSLMMVTRCLSCIREDSNTLCQNEMSKFIETLQTQIAEKDKLDRELLKEKKRMGILADDDEEEKDGPDEEVKNENPEAVKEEKDAPVEELA